jgi:hypothetical protein
VNSQGAILDQHGRVMFYCADCGRPLTSDDFFELGLRLPNRWETPGDYQDAELIDKFQHLECLRAAKAG